jgi:hypothetical protein
MGSIGSRQTHTSNAVFGPWLASNGWSDRFQNTPTQQSAGLNSTLRLRLRRYVIYEPPARIAAAAARTFANARRRAALCRSLYTTRLPLMASSA